MGKKQLTDFIDNTLLQSNLSNILTRGVVKPTDPSTGIVTGNGLFDKLMETFATHLMYLRDMNAVSNEVYATMYERAMSLAMQAALQAAAQYPITITQQENLNNDIINRNGNTLLSQFTAFRTNVEVASIGVDQLPHPAAFVSNASSYTGVNDGSGTFVKSSELDSVVSAMVSTVTNMQNKYGNSEKAASITLAIEGITGPTNTPVTVNTSNSGNDVTYTFNAVVLGADGIEYPEAQGIFVEGISEDPNSRLIYRIGNKIIVKPQHITTINETVIVKSVFRPTYNTDLGVHVTFNITRTS